MPGYRAEGSDSFPSNKRFATSILRNVTAQCFVLQVPGDNLRSQSCRFFGLESTEFTTYAIGLLTTGRKESVIPLSRDLTFFDDEGTQLSEQQDMEEFLEEYDGPPFLYAMVDTCSNLATFDDGLQMILPHMCDKSILTITFLTRANTKKRGFFNKTDSIVNQSIKRIEQILKEAKFKFHLAFLESRGPAGSKAKHGYVYCCHYRLHRVCKGNKGVAWLNYPNPWDEDGTYHPLGSYFTHPEIRPHIPAHMWENLVLKLPEMLGIDYQIVPIGKTLNAHDESIAKLKAAHDESVAKLDAAIEELKELKAASVSPPAPAPPSTDRKRKTPPSTMETQNTKKKKLSKAKTKSTMNEAVDWIHLNYDFFPRNTLPEDTARVPGCFSYIVYQRFQEAGFTLSNVALGRAVKRAAREQGVDDLWKTNRICDDLKRKVPNWVNMKPKETRDEVSSKTEGLLIQNTLFVDGPPNYTIKDGHIEDFLLDTKCHRRGSSIIVNALASNPLMKNHKDRVPVHVYKGDTGTNNEVMLDLGWFHVIEAKEDASMKIYATYTLERQNTLARQNIE